MRYLRSLRRLLKPKRYISHNDAIIHDGARIINNLHDREAITIGAHTHVKGELLTFGHGGRIVLGEYCYVGEHARIWSASRIVIGNRVLISHNVNVFDNLTHPIDPIARHQQFVEIISRGQPKSIDLAESPIEIHDDALIGCMSIILRGVTIGEAAIVGAGSVVTKDVPPFTVVAGNPATVISQVPRGDK